MTVQVLVASMNQQNISLLEKMNIQTDAIVGNQCDRNEVSHFKFGNRQIDYLSFNERGVGLNRNNALMRATGQICTFADEDMVLVDGYAKLVENAFNEIPDADAIVFNLSVIGGAQNRRQNTKIKRLRIHNALNYGAARLSVRNDSIKRVNICFSRLFGGGSIYTSGEDTLFIADMIKRGLKVYTYPAIIGTVDQRDSTWFSGYNEKYFFDKGALFEAISHRLSPLFSLYTLLRQRYKYKDAKLSFIQAYRLMKIGRKGFRTLEAYNGKK
jgi:glycosyltransferase involved in cell wall biosynthesis